MEKTKDILKSLRKGCGYSTAKEFCEAVGISYSTYQNYESGKRLPTAEMLMKLADFYGVTTDALLGRTPLDLTEQVSQKVDRAAAALTNDLLEKAKKFINDLSDARRLTLDGQALPEHLSSNQLAEELVSIILLQVSHASPSKQYLALGESAKQPGDTNNPAAED